MRSSDSNPASGGRPTSAGYAGRGPSNRLAAWLGLPAIRPLPIRPALSYPSGPHLCSVPAPRLLSASEPGGAASSAPVPFSCNVDAAVRGLKSGRAEEILQDLFEFVEDRQAEAVQAHRQRFDLVQDFCGRFERW